MNNHLDTHLLTLKLMADIWRLLGGRATPFTHATSKVHIEYRSIGKVTLHSKRSWFIVQIFDKNETVRYRVYSKNKSQMQGVIDAIYTLKNNLTSDAQAHTQEPT